MKPRKGARSVRWYEPCGTETATRRIYDLRHTFASNALAAGDTLFELARVMGTSAELLDKCYGHLVRGSDDAIRERLTASPPRVGRKWA